MVCGHCHPNGYDHFHPNVYPVQYLYLMYSLLIRFDYFLMVVVGYLLFTITILTNGFLFLGNNIVGFHLGAILALCLETAAIIRVFFRRFSTNIYARILVSFFALILIGVIVFWIRFVSFNI
jgi:hypothetical protein